MNVNITVKLRLMFRDYTIIRFLNAQLQTVKFNVKIGLRSRGATTRPNFDDYTRVSRLIARKYILSRSWYSI